MPPPLAGWHLYHNQHQLSDPLAYVFTEVMRNTSTVHWNELFGQSSVLAKRTNSPKNYMRFHVKRDDTGKPLIVIIYHRLRHYLQVGLTQPPPSKNVWSISLGVDPSLTPLVGIGTDPVVVAAYKALADEIINRVYLDATSPNILGQNVTIVIYDHVHPAGATADGEINDPAWRRTKPIGELGWLAQEKLLADTRWDRDEWLRTVPVPTHTDGSRIKGWGRDLATYGIDDTHVVRTTIRPV